MSQRELQMKGYKHRITWRQREKQREKQREGNRERERERESGRAVNEGT